MKKPVLESLFNETALLLKSDSNKDVLVLSCNYSDQTCFCFKNTKNHNLQLNLSISYFILIIHISFVWAKSGYSWDTY